ncbi:MAG: GHKL domain-containing protein [Bacilli bacterium]|nr:GHKL domain-containing protein [Bacilli bacterium]
MTLHGDNSSITKMLRLLLDNAIKYSNDGGLISISLKQEGKHKKIIMSNTTNGIEKRNLDKLFDRFYRPDSSRARGTGGHGIGLAVVKSIVDLHKGKVTAYSTDGITINFVISLP